MKVKCIVCGREFSVPDKRPALHKDICSIRCEMKYNLKACRVGAGKNDALKMKKSLTCVLVLLAVASTMAATRRPRYSNSRARDAGTIMQGIGGLIGGLSEASARQQQQQQQQQLEYQRQRQMELQRQRLEAERLERQRNLEIQQRQYEMEKQRLALDRQRWREEADKQGIEICGYMVPSWLWQSVVASAVFGLMCLLLKCMFCRRG